MEIKLDEPFSKLYRKGYLRSLKCGRKVVDLFNSDSDRTTISYAKYVYSVHHNVLVKCGYEIDHVDRDKTNDSIENLQMLTIEEHRLKTKSENTKGRRMASYICPSCGCKFYRETRQVKVENPKCSRRCNGLLSLNLR